MSKLKLFLILLVMVGTCALMAGCTSQPSVPVVPKVIISSPTDGATLTAGNVAVTIQVQNFSIVDKQGQANVAGEGHVHYYLDVSPIPSDPAKPAIPANANATWAHVAATSYTFSNVSPGMHTVSVQLANNDHTPVLPLATSTVMVTVAGQPATTPIPTTTTSPPGGQTVSVSLIARNIAFDKSTITVPAGATVVMTFDNQDSGTTHNFA